ncbi:DinB family protein [Poriferisphaera sp. WC338]|uniref:DinB family protein n=1 Tax=Poriferisphaera sp. WC338 TaxID=3425129 RepID=UPI003D8183F8
MDNIDLLLNEFEICLGYGLKLVDSIPAARFTEQTAGIANHPAWTLGHLVWATSYGCSLLGQPSNVPESYNEQFGHGSSPTPNPEDYPDKQTLIAEYKAAHSHFADTVKKTDPSVFNKPTASEDLIEIFPTVGHMISHLLTVHEGMHLGQLASWRRAADNKENAIF